MTITYPELKSLILSGYTNDVVVERYSALQDIWEEEVAVFKNYFTHCKSVLDIGCGTGRTSFYLASEGLTVTAFDMSPSLIEKAQERLKVEPATVTFSVADAESYTYTPQTYDAVWFPYNGIGSIPYQEGKLALLRNIHTTLTPDGLFFFTAHNPLSAQYILITFWKKFRVTFSKYFGMQIRERESSDWYSATWSPEETTYIGMHSQGEWVSMLESVGFTMELVNTKEGVERGVHYPAFLDTYSTNYLFFVCRKR